MALHGITRIYGCCKLTPQFELRFQIEIKQPRKGFNSIRKASVGKERWHVDA
jgi:hypothetical protein